MEPIIRIQDPILGITMIKIYEPKMDNEHTISFLISVDGQCSTLLLQSDGQWDIRLLKIKEQHLIDSICKHIENKFQFHP